eukprot:TRINITY_DN2039_c0_g1_i1.p1 TRINITY_DN2039_c0_g1~~TRINITY_DN2039_c0_g1_i1.p1  ORF type:complete len:279 (-),score=84.30 TRINITY_DN2039_c0_g1_i1:51-887(-)
MQQTASAKTFGGYVKSYKHKSNKTNCEMVFSVYLPQSNKPVPYVIWLSGLTCTDQNFITKAGAFETASQLGIAIICPDTSPRGVEIEGDRESWDFGVGAGFYVDATEDKWKNNYNMFSYVTEELVDLVESNLPLEKGNRSIFGHSMGGHGALICALKKPGFFKSVSAFSPISNPINCPWGQKAFKGYLGDNQENWKKYDATELIKTYQGPSLNILIDVGTEDNFLKQKQLLPENFVQASLEKGGVNPTVRYQSGYDHSYYFISSFVAEHLKHHAKFLF